MELDDAATLKLKQTVAQWDAQRAPLRQQMFDLAQVLRRAAKGDTTAYGQVDQSIQKIIALRAQMHQIDQSHVPAALAGAAAPEEGQARAGHRPDARDDAGDDARWSWWWSAGESRTTSSRRRRPGRSPRASCRCEPEPLESAAPRLTWKPRRDAREEEVPRHPRAAVRQRSAPPRSHGGARPDGHLRALPALRRARGGVRLRGRHPRHADRALRGEAGPDARGDGGGGLGVAPGGPRATSASRSTPSTPPTARRTSTTPS